MALGKRNGNLCFLLQFFRQYIVPIVFYSLKLSTRGAVHFVFSSAFQLFFLEKACQTFHLSIIVENSTLYQCQWERFHKTNWQLMSFNFTGYRLFKLCSPPSKLIITNITYLHWQISQSSFFFFFFFFFNPENFIMSFFTVLDFFLIIIF